MLSPDQLPTGVEEVSDSSMGTHKSLGLLDRFELPHTSFPNPGRLVRLFCPIVRILRRIMDDLRNQLSMSNAIASQLIRHDLSGFTTMDS